MPRIGLAIHENDVNKQKSRNTSRDCDRCGNRLADCECMEIKDPREQLRQVPAIMARREAIVRQGRSSVDAFDSRFQKMADSRLLPWLSNPKTWAEAAPDGILLSAAYEFLLSLRRSALTSTTPHGRASWGAVAYKSSFVGNGRTSAWTFTQELMFDDRCPGSIAPRPIRVRKRRRRRYD